MSVGVELAGGAFDGRLLVLPGEPPDRLELPVSRPMWLVESDGLVFDTLTFHRCVISDVTHLWRYVLGPHGPCCTWSVPFTP